MGQRKITIVWTGDEKLRLRFTIPAGWDELSLEACRVARERLEGQPRAVDDVTMSRRGGAPRPPDALYLDTGRRRVRARGADGR